ncbi:hypothetical protein GCM10020218_067790 [Dactylosporangium vinaceum]
MRQRNGVPGGTAHTMCDPCPVLRFAGGAAPQRRLRRGAGAVAVAGCGDARGHRRTRLYTHPDRAGIVLLGVGVARYAAGGRADGGRLRCAGPRLNRRRR